MVNSIRENSYYDQDTIEETLVDYQEEKQWEIQDIQLEAFLPWDTTNKNLQKHTQDSQNFLVTPHGGMAYIHGTTTNITICVDDSQYPLIIDTGSHFSIIAKRNYTLIFQIWKTNSCLQNKRTSKVLEAK
ncbi:hypothetical protein O181_046172 [Austropuccinia psidii MF-1]|uniref:Uncharacterized protein n=1 Tax=Austropuccinia psidii MF-1 TaxID=1389203 RepID=A0A9Q3HJF4_9BASI|nr:hypothetical protein [Austropuccinia psidii MF-1]